MTCVYCPHPIKNDDVFWVLKCGNHMAHGTHGTTLCRACARVDTPVTIAGPVPVAPQQQQQQAPAAVTQNPNALRRLANNAARRTETLKPYQPSGLVSWFGGFLRVAGRVGEASIPDDESDDPLALLAAGVSLTTMVKKHGFDITELINDHGITIADFFRNGYTIGDMCDAFGSRMNLPEGMRVLYYLGMTDEYISAMPQHSQPAVMKARLGFNVDSLIRDLDYKFVPGRWTLPQMVEVGLTMPVVMKQGMQTLEDWLALRATARNDLDLFHFGVTPQLEASLARPGLTPQTPSVQPPPAPSYSYNPVATQSWQAPSQTGISLPGYSAPAPVSPVAVAEPSYAPATPADFLPGGGGGNRKVASAPSQPVQTRVIRVDTTPRLIDRPILPELVILPQHRPTNKPAYSLK